MKITRTSAPRMEHGAQPIPRILARSVLNGGYLDGRCTRDEALAAPVASSVAFGTSLWR
jgi:hypothetical protein